MAGAMTSPAAGRMARMSATPPPDRIPRCRASRRPAALRRRLAPRGRPLAWTVVAATVAAVVLVAAGTGLGLLLRGPGTPAAATTAVGPAGAPPCVSVLPPGAAPPGGTPVPLSSTPQLCVSQPYGDGDTVYVIHGTGFVPFQPVTIRLAGRGVSPDRPVADQQGTFNYAIDQGHLFFPGAIPPGTYTAIVTTAGGRSVSVSFSVYRAASEPRPSAS